MWQQPGLGLGSAPREQGQEERKRPQAVPGEAQAAHQEEFVPGKGGQALELPKEVWSPHTWKCPRNSWRWHSVLWGQGGDGAQQGLHGVEGLFQLQ